VVIAGIPLSVGSSIMLVPNYLYMMQFNMTDKWFTLILLYTAYNLPMAIWLLMAGIKAIPIEIEEAATVDGCSKLYIISRIIPPLLKPSIAAASLFIFIGAWNEYITASVMINSASLKTIQMAIYDYLGYFGQEWGPLTAAATIAILTILLVFTFLGKMLVSGLTAGAVKG
jgi:ABC-type glycerol-3-phosphate transport system permease component